MTNEIKVSVDSPEFRDLLFQCDGDGVEGMNAREALIAHINAWSDERCNRAINQLAATPVAGWVSVEDERKPELDEQIIVFVRTVKYGEDDDGRPFEDHGSEIFMGEYRKYGDLEPQFDCFISPISDGDWITHWMPLPLPPAPVVTPTPTQQEQS